MPLRFNPLKAHFLLKFNNGKWIAFNSEKDGNSSIYIMKVNGSRIKQLTNNKLYDERPCWSTDGKRILFTRGNQRTMKFTLLSISKKGKNVKSISPKNHSIIRGNWSPDGSQIVAQKIIIKKETPKKEVLLSFKPELFDDYVGSYALEASPKQVFTFRRKENRFFGDGAGKKNIELFPESETSFFQKTFQDKIHFIEIQMGL